MLIYANTSIQNRIQDILNFNNFIIYHIFNDKGHSKLHKAWSTIYIKYLIDLVNLHKDIWTLIDR